MSALLVLLGLGAVLGGLVYFMASRRKSGSLAPTARVEYWVYSPFPSLPNEADLASRILKENPHGKGAATPIGKEEALTQTDVRFSFTLMKKSNNQLLFRPEVICEPDTLGYENVPQLVRDAVSIFRIQFVADDPLRNLSAAAYCAHVADAASGLSDGRSVFDKESQRFWTPADFSNALHAHPDGRGFDLHVETRWTETMDEGRAFTRGMAKAGLPDVVMEGVPLDHKTLALFLVAEAARQCWVKMALAEVYVEGFGENFIIEFNEPVCGSSSHRGWLAEIKASRKVPL